MQAGVSSWRARSQRARRTVDNEPAVLAEHGKGQDDTLRRTQVNRVMRAAGCCKQSRFGGPYWTLVGGPVSRLNKPIKHGEIRQQDHTTRTGKGRRVRVMAWPLEPILTRFQTLALGVLVALTVVFPTLTAASLFGTLGVSGVPIGFAFKDIFQNFLAGLLILITRPFRIGDPIISGEHEGTVGDIQVRATLLRTYDNRRVVIPNSELYTNRVIVNTAYDRRRLAVTVGIGYGDDIAQARRIILDTLAGVKEIRSDPAPAVLVRELADFSVNLEVQYGIDPPIRREVVESQGRVLEALKPALIAAGIGLPLPTQQVLFHDQTEETDGDRTRQREGWPARAENPRSRAALTQRPETP